MGWSAGKPRQGIYATERVCSLHHHYHYYYSHHCSYMTSYLILTVDSWRWGEVTDHDLLAMVMAGEGS